MVVTSMPSDLIFAYSGTLDVPAADADSRRVWRKIHQGRYADLHTRTHASGASIADLGALIADKSSSDTDLRWMAMLMDVSDGQKYGVSGNIQYAEYVRDNFLRSTPELRLLEDRVAKLFNAKYADPEKVGADYTDNVLAVILDLRKMIANLDSLDMADLKIPDDPRERRENFEKRRQKLKDKLTDLKSSCEGRLKRCVYYENTTSWDRFWTRDINAAIAEQDISSRLPDEADGESADDESVYKDAFSRRTRFLKEILDKQERFSRGDYSGVSSTGFWNVNNGRARKLFTLAGPFWASLSPRELFLYMVYFSLHKDDLGAEPYGKVMQQVIAALVLAKMYDVEYADNRILESWLEFLAGEENISGKLGYGNSWRFSVFHDDPWSCDSQEVVRYVESMMGGGFNFGEKMPIAFPDMYEEGCLVSDVKRRFNFKDFCSSVMEQVCSDSTELQDALGDGFRGLDTAAVGRREGIFAKSRNVGAERLASEEVARQCVVAHGNLGVSDSDKIDSGFESVLAPAQVWHFCKEGGVSDSEVAARQDLLSREFDYNSEAGKFLSKVSELHAKLRELRTYTVVNQEAYAQLAKDIGSTLGALLAEFVRVDRKTPGNWFLFLGGRRVQYGLGNAYIEALQGIDVDLRSMLRQVRDTLRDSMLEDVEYASWNVAGVHLDKVEEVLGTDFDGASFSRKLSSKTLQQLIPSNKTDTAVRVYVKKDAEILESIESAFNSYYVQTSVMEEKKVSAWTRFWDFKLFGWQKKLAESFRAPQITAPYLVGYLVNFFTGDGSSLEALTKNGDLMRQFIDALGANGMNIDDVLKAFKKNYNPMEDETIVDRKKRFLKALWLKKGELYGGRGQVYSEEQIDRFFTNTEHDYLTEILRVASRVLRTSGEGSLLTSLAKEGNVFLSMTHRRIDSIETFLDGLRFVERKSPEKFRALRRLANEHVNKVVSSGNWIRVDGSYAPPIMLLVEPSVRARYTNACLMRALSRSKGDGSLARYDLEDWDQVWTRAAVDTAKAKVDRLVAPLFVVGRNGIWQLDGILPKNYLFVYGTKATVWQLVVELSRHGGGQKAYYDELLGHLKALSISQRIFVLLQEAESELMGDVNGNFAASVPDVLAGGISSEDLLKVRGQLDESIRRMKVLVLNNERFTHFNSAVMRLDRAILKMAELVESFGSPKQKVEVYSVRIAFMLQIAKACSSPINTSRKDSMRAGVKRFFDELLGGCGEEVISWQSFLEKYDVEDEEAKELKRELISMFHSLLYDLPPTSEIWRLAKAWSKDIPELRYEVGRAAIMARFNGKFVGTLGVWSVHEEVGTASAEPVVGGDEAMAGERPDNEVLESEIVSWLIEDDNAAMREVLDYDRDKYFHPRQREDEKNEEELRRDVVREFLINGTRHLEEHMKPGYKLWDEYIEKILEMIGYGPAYISVCKEVIELSSKSFLGVPREAESGLLGMHGVLVGVGYSRGLIGNAAQVVRDRDRGGCEKAFLEAKIPEILTQSYKLFGHEDGGEPVVSFYHDDGLMVLVPGGRGRGARLATYVLKLEGRDNLGKYFNWLEERLTEMVKAATISVSNSEGIVPDGCQCLLDIAEMRSFLCSGAGSVVEIFTDVGLAARRDSGTVTEDILQVVKNRQKLLCLVLLVGSNEAYKQRLLEYIQSLINAIYAKEVAEDNPIRLGALLALYDLIEGGPEALYTFGRDKKIATVGAYSSRAQHNLEVLNVFYTIENLLSTRTMATATVADVRAAERGPVNILSRIFSSVSPRSSSGGVAVREAVSTAEGDALVREVATTDQMVLDKLQGAHGSVGVSRECIGKLVVRLEDMRHLESVVFAVELADELPEGADIGAHLDSEHRAAVSELRAVEERLRAAEEAGEECGDVRAQVAAAKEVLKATEQRKVRFNILKKLGLESQFSDWLQLEKQTEEMRRRRIAGTVAGYGEPEFLKSVLASAKVWRRLEQNVDISVKHAEIYKNFKTEFSWQLGELHRLIFKSEDLDDNTDKGLRVFNRATDEGGDAWINSFEEVLGFLVTGYAILNEVDLDKERLKKAVLAFLNKILERLIVLFADMREDPEDSHLPGAAREWARGGEEILDEGGRLIQYTQNPVVGGCIKNFVSAVSWLRDNDMLTELERGGLLDQVRTLRTSSATRELRYDNLWIGKHIDSRNGVTFALYSALADARDVEGVGVSPRGFKAEVRDWTLPIIWGNLVPEVIAVANVIGAESGLFGDSESGLSRDENFVLCLHNLTDELGKQEVVKGNVLFALRELAFFTIKKTDELHTALLAAEAAQRTEEMESINHKLEHLQFLSRVISRILALDGLYSLVSLDEMDDFGYWEDDALGLVAETSVGDTGVPDMDSEAAAQHSVHGWARLLAGSAEAVSGVGSIQERPAEREADVGGAPAGVVAGEQRDDVSDSVQEEFDSGFALEDGDEATDTAGSVWKDIANIMQTDSGIKLDSGETVGSGSLSALARAFIEEVSEDGDAAPGDDAEVAGRADVRHLNTVRDAIIRHHRVDIGQGVDLLLEDLLACKRIILVERVVSGEGPVEGAAEAQATPKTVEKSLSFAALSSLFDMLKIHADYLATGLSYAELNYPVNQRWLVFFSMLMLKLKKLADQDTGPEVKDDLKKLCSDTLEDIRHSLFAAYVNVLIGGGQSGSELELPRMAFSLREIFTNTAAKNNPTAKQNGRNLFRLLLLKWVKAGTTPEVREKRAEHVLTFYGTDVSEEQYRSETADAGLFSVSYRYWQRVAEGEKLSAVDALLGPRLEDNSPDFEHAFWQDAAHMGEIARLRSAILDGDTEAVVEQPSSGSSPARVLAALGDDTQKRSFYRHLSGYFREGDGLNILLGLTSIFEARVSAITPGEDGADDDSVPKRIQDNLDRYPFGMGSSDDFQSECSGPSSGRSSPSFGGTFTMRDTTVRWVRQREEQQKAVAAALCMAQLRAARAAADEEDRRRDEAARRFLEAALEVQRDGGRELTDEEQASIAAYHQRRGAEQTPVLVGGAE